MSFFSLSIKTTFLLLFFTSGFFFASSEAIAAPIKIGYCACTTVLNDCQAFEIKANKQDEKSCEKKCAAIPEKTTVKYVAPAASPNTAGDVLIEECKKTHAKFEADKKAAAEASKTQPKTPYSTPILNVEIPGVSFSQPVIEEGKIKSTYLADYLNAFYKFLINTSLIVAVVMIMVGGLQYVLGAASEVQVKKGKERVTNAVQGLVLLLCVYVILYAVNPQMTLFNPIVTQEIDKIALSEFGGDTEDDGSDTSLPASSEIYCPHSGGSAEIQKIVGSFKGRVVYRWGGKWNMSGPYGLSTYKMKTAKDPNAPGYAAWSKVLALSQQKCPQGLKCLDCSGFVSAVLSCAGIKISGGSIGILNSGRKNLKDNPIDFNNAIVDGVPLKPGDVFGWTEDDAKFAGKPMPGHVLIYVGKVLNGKPALAESTGGKNGIGYSPGLNANLRPFTEAEVKHLLPGDTYYRYRRM